jgi:MoaA/NifB/PqqE/SkfB family radical SAM enzyme
MIRLAQSMGVDRIQVMNFVPFLASQKYNALFYHRSLANQYFTESRRVAAELNFDINIPRNFDAGNFSHRESPLIRMAPSEDLHPLNPPDSLALVHCYRPWQVCVVNELGDVRPSDVYWRSMGNLHAQSFPTIWNNWKYRRLRASVNIQPDSICRSCRLPQFDSEENRAAMQLVPSVKQLLMGSAKSFLTRPKVTFVGVMDPESDPTEPGPNVSGARTREPLDDHSFDSSP